MKRTTGFFKRVTHRYTKPLDSGFSQVNLFEDLAKYGDSLLEIEKEMLRHLKSQIDLLFSYSTNLTNMDLSQTNIRLQRSMKWMTVAMLVFTIVTVILTIIAPIIWDWLRTIFFQFDCNLMQSDEFNARPIYSKM